MSIEAVGAYLRALREYHGMNRAQIAAALETTQVQISRIEGGQVDTRAYKLLLFARLVQADLNVLVDLLLDADAAAADGTRRAVAADASTSGRVTNPSGAAVSELARLLSTDRERLGLWLGYGHRLVEERDSPIASSLPRRSGRARRRGADEPDEPTAP